MTFLHRLRLWLGLFRWKNYMTVAECDWFEITEARTKEVARIRRQTIRHIRTCVRKGIRP